MRFNTALLHGDFRGDKNTGATQTPIYQSSAFEHASAETLEKIFNNMAPGFSYSRISNPTIEAFEKRMTVLEGGVASVACSSGMAAITNAFTNILQSGDEIVCSASLYGGSIDLFRDLESFGIKTHYVNNNDVEQFRAATNENTRLYFAETIGNPRLDVTDIRLIALDLDGTLLNDSKEVSNESTDAVRKLISRGIYVVPTSGRSSNDELFVEKLKPLGIKYFIGENGGIIKDCMDQKNIRVVSMNLMEAFDLINELEKKRIFTYFVSNEKVYYSTKNITSFLMNAFDEFFKVSSATEGSLTDVIRERNVIPEKIGTLLNSPNDVKKIMELKNKYRELLIMQSNILAVEACSKETSKGIALEWLCEKLGINRENVAAIGDSESDISMLKYAGIPVAMGNALEEVKK